MKGKCYIRKMISVLPVAATLSLVGVPAFAGWYAGSCADHYADGGCGVCIEHNSGLGWWHINGPGSLHTDTSWNGSLGNEVPGAYGTPSTGSMTPFLFSGDADLACFDGAVNLDCTLSLSGVVKKDGSTVGINVVGGDATPGNTLCNYVDMFFTTPWGAGENNQHTIFNGINVNTNPPLIAGIGNIAFRVRNPLLFPPNLVNISNAHMHDVVFDNAGSTSASCFSFGLNGSDPKIYDSAHNPTGCSIQGELCVQNDEDVNIHYKAC